MTTDEARKAAAILLAFAEGKKIEIGRNESWLSVEPNLFSTVESLAQCRINPEPAVVWCNEHKTGNGESYFNAYPTKELASKVAVSPIRTAVKFVEAV